MNLRQKVLKGGAFLIMRQAVGIVISVVGVLVVMRMIGPRQYGLFAGGAGIVTFLFMFGNWGLDVYLLRKTEEPDDKEFHQAFTLLLVIALVLFVGVVALRHKFASFVKMPEESSLLFVMALAIPLNMLALPAIVKLDRELNFKQVAINELSGQISYYAIAVPLAFLGVGAWAPVMGFVMQQAVILALSCRAVRFWPRLHWQSDLVKRMLSYGLSYSSSIWVYQLRDLVNPVVVGRFAGAEAVGFVAASVRIATLLSFAKTATWRLAMPALAKLNHDQVRLRRSMAEGIRFQAVFVGLPLASFALLAPLLIPLGFGRGWTSAVRVFPLIALGYLSNAMFNLHCSVLYMLRKNWQVTWFNVIHVLLFAGSAALFVPFFGFVGYGWAEVVAVLSYPILYTSVAGQIGSLSYAPGAMWYGISAVMLIASALNRSYRYLAFCLPVLPFLASVERRQFMGYISLLLSRGESQA